MLPGQSVQEGGMGIILCLCHFKSEFFKADRIHF